MKESYIGIFIILIIILVINKALKDTKRPNNPNRNHKYKKDQGPWNTGWIWNEKTQMWDPPSHLKVKKEANQSTASIKEEKSESINYRQSYQPKYLFTMNEWYNYKKLKEIADVKNYVVCPKVRLLDIIEPRKGEKHYKTLFYKVQAKHVDFVICDQTMRIKAIIELDDSSHNRQDRKERDQFVDTILRSVGYTVIHVKAIENNILDTV